MIPKKKKSIRILSAVAVLITVAVLWLLWADTALEVNTYTVYSDKISEAFNGYRIAQVSDLHNAKIGENNERLLSLLAEAEPDIIALTGDLIDSRRTDIETAVSLVKEAVKIAPCYYVTGNHEARVAEYEELKECLSELGAVILDNKRAELKKNGESITIIGIGDPSFDTDYLFGDDSSAVKENLLGLTDGDEEYIVLLSHRPEMFDVYAESAVDLVLSGHAHGGQIRLPFVGGIYAPHQGFFPEYDSGLYTNGAVTMMVSRGVGNSIFPLRVNNRPEIIIIELQGEG